MLDLMVALTLLIAAMSLVGPLVVRHGQVLKSQRHYRLAMDELTNQLERLAALAPERLSDAMEQLALSPFIAERLVGAKIEGELAPVEAGVRITLHMTWDEIGHRREPVTLAAWVFARPAAAANAAEGAGP
jgi:hypothetical protein